MEANYFRNQLRAYRVLLAILAAEGEDEMCRGCIGFDGATTRSQKGLRKLALDLEGLSDPEEEKRAVASQIALLRQQAERLPPSDDPTGMKTAGLCKIGPDCLPLDGAMEMLKQIGD